MIAARGEALVVTEKLVETPTRTVRVDELVNRGTVARVSVSVWDVVPALLTARTVNLVVDPEVNVGVPETVAVPLDPVRTDTPLGNVPVTETTGTGTPVAATVNENGTPDTTVADDALVMVGTRLTVTLIERVVTPAADVAVTSTGYVPAVPAAGTPDSA